MKLSFTWKSGHRRLQLRLLIADGDGVKILGAQGEETPPPSVVAKGAVLQIASRSVAYGGRPQWALRVLLVDPTGTQMDGLTVKALYDDTVEPTGSEAICDDEHVDPDKATDFDKQLTIPDKA